MPELTQQQWLEEQFTGHGMERGKGHAYAQELVSAWPSSPQGLAVKALVEVLADAEAGLTELLTYLRRHGHNPELAQARLLTIKDAKEAARKAGLMEDEP